MITSYVRRDGTIIDDHHPIEPGAWSAVNFRDPRLSGRWVRVDEQTFIEATVEQLNALQELHRRRAMGG